MLETIDMVGTAGATKFKHTPRKERKMDIIRLEKGKSAVEIEPFNQKENGGEDITYTLYYFPDRLSQDFDPNECESFDERSKAIKKAIKLLGE